MAGVGAVHKRDGDIFFFSFKKKRIWLRTLRQESVKIDLRYTETSWS